MFLPPVPCPAYGDEALQRRSGQRESRAAADAMTADMESLLSRLRAVVDTMSAAVAGSSGTPAPALQHTMQRHAEILHDYNQEFRKTRDALAASRDHADLLAGAAAAAAEGGRIRTAGGGAGLEGLYKERASVSAATSGADTAIATGLNLKEDLERQRAMFASMVERMETMSEGLPVVNRLIGQIRRKKKRDVFIMAAVVGIMLFVTFSWKVLR